jgi:predicted permease
LRGSGAGVTAGQRWLTLRNALIVFQVAISAALLGGTGIFLQMLDASRAQRAGFAIDGVAVLETDPRYVGYSATAARNATEELRRRVTAIPGVQTAVVSRGLPMETTGMRVVIDRAPGGPAVAAGAIWAGPRYFELLRIPIVYGRAIDDRDRADTPRVAVVSEAMARQYFGAENAVGRRFRSEQESSRWFEVVGVAQNTGTADLQGDLVDPTPQLFYRSFSQMDVAPDTVIARTSLDAASLLGAMQREIRAIDTAWPVIHAKTMAQLLEDSLAAPRAAAALLGALGTLGLCLAGIGLYAVVAFRVARRTREIGIRMALGARGAQAVWVEIREVAVLLGTGIGLGLLLSLLVVLAIRAFSAAAPGVTLYRPAADPAALVSTAAFMGAVGLAAALAPALRAIRQDPLRALRRE